LHIFEAKYMTIPDQLASSPSEWERLVQLMGSWKKNGKYMKGNNLIYSAVWVGNIYRAQVKNLNAW